MSNADKQDSACDNRDWIIVALIAACLVLLVACGVLIMLVYRKDAPHEVLVERPGRLVAELDKAHGDLLFARKKAEDQSAQVAAALIRLADEKLTILRAAVGYFASQEGGSFVFDAESEYVHKGRSPGSTALISLETAEDATSVVLASCVFKVGTDPNDKNGIRQLAELERFVEYFSGELERADLSRQLTAAVNNEDEGLIFLRRYANVDCEIAHIADQNLFEIRLRRNRER